MTTRNLKISLAAKAQTLGGNPDATGEQGCSIGLVFLLSVSQQDPTFLGILSYSLAEHLKD